MECEIAGAEAHSRGWSTFDTLHGATNAFASTACEAYAETIHVHAAARDLSDSHHTITIHTHQLVAFSCTLHLCNSTNRDLKSG